MNPHTNLRTSRPLPSLSSCANSIPGNHRLRTVGLLVTALLALASVPPAQAILLLKVEQIGRDVVVTGSGSVNLSDLSFGDSTNEFTNTFTATQLYAGPAAFSNGAVKSYAGLQGPSTIGTKADAVLLPDDSVASSGDLLGLVSNDQSNGDGTGKPLLILPQSYTSNEPLAGSSFYSETSYADFGLTEGTSKTWSWGSGANADSLQVQAGSTQVPAPFCIAGAGAAFSCVKRLKLNSRLLKRHARK